jgi:F-type H+-transporting ATPase subunit b
MKIRRITFGILVASALAFGAVPATSFAQETNEGTAHAGEQPAGEHAAEAGGEEHAGGEHGHEHGPGPINYLNFGQHDAEGRSQPPLIANIINFAILLLILIWAVRRVMNPALNDRRVAIESEIGEAQRLRAEAEAIHREYTERLENMEQELAQMRTEFQRAGEAEYKRIIDEANQRAERMRTEGEFAIQQEMKQLRDDLLRQAVATATTSAEKTIRGQISPQDQTRLADEYVANLEKQGASA